MKNMISVGMMFSLLSALHAQPNQQMKTPEEAQRKLDSMMKNNPSLQQYMNKNNQNNTTVSIPAQAFISKPDTAFLSNLKLPPRNSMALALIPSRTMTRDELKNFVHDLAANVKPALQKYYSTEDLSIASIGSTGASNAACLAWYKGRPDVALELALAAADKDCDDILALSNLSGILDLCGFPYKAVPVLQYVKEKEPENSTVNNNLGQAYVKMGDIQKARAYLQEAIASSPDHPNANFTMAIISYAQGDKGAAQKYCESCLRGGFIPNAWNMLKSINPKAKMMDYVRHRYKPPESFNPDKYPLLPQIRNTADVLKYHQLYADFKKMLVTENVRYEKMAKEEQKWVAENMAKNLMAKINEKKDPLRPFGEFANVVLGDILETHGEKILELNKYDSSYQEQLKALNDQFAAEKKKIDDQYGVSEDNDGEGGVNTENKTQHCNALNELANAYLPQFADLREAWQKKWLYAEKDYFNDYSFWCYVASTDDHHYHQLFYQLVSEYLGLLEKLSTSRALAFCIHLDTTHKNEKDLEFGEGKCPLNAEIPIANLGKEAEEFEGFLGKIALDCEGLGLEFGEGLIFNFDRKFSTGETTLAFGGGASEHIPYIPVIEGGAKMQFYITFGGSTAWDIGIKWEAEMDIKGMYHPEQKAGWTVGINSGLDSHFDTFSEGEIPGALSDRLGKELFGIESDHQVNPNIKMFNNNNNGKKE